MIEGSDEYKGKYYQNSFVRKLSFLHVIKPLPYTCTSRDLYISSFMNILFMIYGGPGQNLSQKSYSYLTI